MMKFNDPVKRPALYSIRSKTPHGRTEKIYTLFDTTPPAAKPLSRETACLDAIAVISEQNGCAKVKELARHLGITTTAVTTLLCRLEEKQLIIYRRHKGAYLTEDGIRKNTENRSHRMTLYNFLITAGIPAETARSDAETLNRELSEGTLRTLSSYLEKLSGEEEADPGKTPRTTAGSREP